MYNIAFGSVELPKPEGKPDVFVISSCGSGIDTFRQLQKDGVPFLAGILYKNDIDYVVAKSLAAEVFEEEPFMPVSDDVYERAVRALKRCSRVIDTGAVIGDSNRRIADLINTAEKLGILEKTE